MSERVLYVLDGAVATITLNRPQVMNALDAEMIVALRHSCEHGAEDKRAKVVLLRGAGSAFLAGGDVAMFRKNLARLGDMTIGLAGELHRAILALRRAPKPVIAAVHGAVAGAGMSIMMAADLVVAAAGTQFTMAYSRIGTNPDGGATWFLPRLIGYQKAMELLLLSDTVDAAAMHAMGVINQVVPPAELECTALELAQRLAAGPARAYAETKALVNQALECGLANQLEAEARAFARCAGTADFAEGVTAFAKKRKANFTGE